jgi:hypothetical protein
MERATVTERIAADVPPHLHPLYASDEQLAAQGRREMWEQVEAKHKQDAKRPAAREGTWMFDRAF